MSAPVGAPVAATSSDAAGLRWGVLLSVLFAVVGIVLAFALVGSSISNHDLRAGHNIFYNLFADNEPIGCALVLLGLTVLVWCYQRGLTWNPAVAKARTLWLVAGAVVVVTAGGTFAVTHNYGLSMDEYCADFQARLFAHGKIVSEIPEEWRPVERWMRPLFIVHDAEKHTWTTAYLPGYGAIRAVFQVLGAPWLTNPLLAGISVLAIAGIARRLWPDSPSHMWVAVALLAASPQFLLTSMTAYSMPAHLALNLVWLWLYVRGDRNSLLLAPLVGFLAIGLHQPNVHPLFALPFCARFVWQKRWGWAAYYAVTYCLAIAAWLMWWKFLRADAIHTSVSFMSLPDFKAGMVQVLNIVLMLTWQSAGTFLLLVIGLWRWKSLPPVLKDAAWSCLITFIFYIQFTSHQGHGWGYRYFHAVLGNWMLLAVAGWGPLCELLGAAKARALAAAAIAVTLVACLPLRAWQVESFTRPYADADAALNTIKAEVAFIPVWRVWYGQDLVRNDPLFESKPKRVRMTQLVPQVLEYLETRGRGVIIRGEQLEAFGIRSANTDRDGEAESAPAERPARAEKPTTTTPEPKP